MTRDAGIGRGPHKATRPPERRKRLWCFRDLFVDHVTGKLRETAVWSNTGKAAMTWAFVYVVLNGKSTEWLWLAYGGIVVAHEASARFFNQQQRKMDEAK